MSRHTGLLIDASQVIALAAKFPAATVAGRAAVGRAVGRGALNVKKEAAAIVRANDTHRRLTHYARSISYDVDESNADQVVAEIGPDTERRGRAGRQAELAHIIEYGTARHGPPIRHMGPALDSETKLFDAWVGKAAHDAMVKALR